MDRQATLTRAFQHGHITSDDTRDRRDARGRGFVREHLHLDAARVELEAILGNLGLDPMHDERRLTHRQHPSGTHDGELGMQHQACSY